MELLPAGNINTPSAKLQVEWFYMTFHNSTRLTVWNTSALVRNSVKRTYRLSPSTSSLSTIPEQSKLLIVDLSTRKYEVTQESKRVTNYKSATRTRCDISPTNADPEGLTRNETTTTTVAVSYAKAGNVTTTGVMRQLQEESPSLQEESPRLRLQEEYPRAWFKEESSRVQEGIHPALSFARPTCQPFLCGVSPKPTQSS